MYQNGQGVQGVPQNYAEAAKLEFFEWLRFHEKRSGVRVLHARPLAEQDRLGLLVVGDV
jgi:hypothetical protein